jgi:hypothetical protein
VRAFECAFSVRTSSFVHGLMTRRAVFAFTVLADFVPLTVLFKALGIIQVLHLIAAQIGMRCGDKKAGSLTYSIPSDNWYVIVPPPVEEESDNLSNGRRQRDDGSEGVANSDQIVGVHLIPAGGDGRSFMPPRGYTNQSFSPSSRNSLASLSAEGGSRARSSTLLLPPNTGNARQSGLSPVSEASRRDHARRGRPPRGRAIRIAAGEIIARRTVSAGGDIAGDGSRRFSLSH